MLGRVRISSVLWAISGLLAIAGAGALAMACSSDESSSGDTDAGDDAGGETYTYAPDGCAYEVSPPASRAFTGFAADEAVPFDDPTTAEPLRVRIGLGGNTTAGEPGYADPTTTAAFSWQTKGNVKAARLRFGEAPGALAEIRKGFSWTTPAPAVGFGANEPETYHHEVHVCGLKPGTTYYYQVGGGPDGGEVWSAEQSFTTVPASGAVTVGISGDARSKVDVWQLLQGRMRDAGVNIQLTSGDLVDLGGSQSLYETWLDAVWKDPQNPGQFLTLGQQMMVMIAGNHENEAARFYANFSIPGAGEYSETYASFDIGNTHFVMVDDQPVAVSPTGDHAKAILAWLEADLAKANGDRAAHPFIVVVQHRGLYTTSKHADDSDVIKARAALAPLYDKHGVDIVITGHEHNFEKTKPLKAGVDPAGDPQIVGPEAGRIYIVNGGSGADPYSVTEHPAAYADKGIEFGDGTPYVGFYGIFTLDGRTLKLDTYGLKAAGGGVAGDEVVDTVDLSRP